MDQRMKEKDTRHPNSETKVTLFLYPGLLTFSSLVPIFSFLIDYM